MKSSFATTARLTERTIRERDLKAGTEVLAELTAEVTRRQRNVLPIPGWGLAHADAGLNDIIWSVPLDRLPLRARFKLVNGVLVPMFASGTELEMPMVWRVPPEVRLVFAVRTEPEEDRVKVNGNWLFAFGRGPPRLPAAAPQPARRLHPLHRAV